MLASSGHLVFVKRAWVVRPDHAMPGGGALSYCFEDVAWTIAAEVFLVDS